MNRPGGIAPDLRQGARRIREITARIVDIPTRRRHKLSNTSISAQNVVIVAVTLNGGQRGMARQPPLGDPAGPRKAASPSRP